MDGASVAKIISAGLFSAREHTLTFHESFNAKNMIRPRKFNTQFMIVNVIV